MSKKPLDEKTFFIIKKPKRLFDGVPKNYHIHDRKMYTLTTAVKKVVGT